MAPQTKHHQQQQQQHRRNTHLMQKKHVELPAHPLPQTVRDVWRYALTQEVSSDLKLDDDNDAMVTVYVRKILLADTLSEQVHCVHSIERQLQSHTQLPATHNVTQHLHALVDGCFDILHTDLPLGKLPGAIHKVIEAACTAASNGDITQLQQRTQRVIDQLSRRPTDEQTALLTTLLQWSSSCMTVATTFYSSCTTVLHILQLALASSALDFSTVGTQLQSTVRALLLYCTRATQQIEQEMQSSAATPLSNTLSALIIRVDEIACSTNVWKDMMMQCSMWLLWALVLTVNKPQHRAQWYMALLTGSNPIAEDQPTALQHSILRSQYADKLHSNAGMRLAYLRAIVSSAKLDELIVTTGNQQRTLLSVLGERIAEHCESSDAFIVYAAVENLNVWMQRCRDVVSQPSTRAATTSNLSSDIQQTLRRIADTILQHCWNHSQKTIVAMARRVFSSYIELMNSIGAADGRQHDWMGEVITALLSVQHEQHSRSAYNLLNCLLPSISAVDVLQIAPWLPAQLIVAQALRTMAPSSYALLVTLLKQSKQEMLQTDRADGLTVWRACWLPAVVQSLQSDNQLLRDGVSNTILPTIFDTIDAGSFTVMLDHAVNQTTQYTTTLQRSRGIITLMKVGRRCSQLYSSDFDAIAQSHSSNSTSKLHGITEQFLQQCIIHLDVDLRTEASEMICRSGMQTDLPSALELRLVTVLLQSNLKVEGAQLMRSRLVGDVIHFVTRIRDSVLRLITVERQQKQLEATETKSNSSGVSGADTLTYDGVAKLQCYSIIRPHLDFMADYLQLLLRHMYPGSPYERQCTALELLYVTHTVWQYSSRNTENVLWPVYQQAIVTPSVTLTLLNLLSSSYERTRSVAFDLLQLFPSPLPGYETKQQLLPLLQSAVQLCSASRYTDTETGALMLRVITSKYVVSGLQWRVDIGDGATLPPIDTQSFVDSHRHSAVLHLLTSVLSHLQTQSAALQHTTVTERFSQPNSRLHGWLLFIRYMLGDIDWKQWDTDSSITKQWQQTASLLLNIADQVTASTLHLHSLSHAATAIKQAKFDADEVKDPSDNSSKSLTSQLTAMAVQQDHDESAQPTELDCRGHVVFPSAAAAEDETADADADAEQGTSGEQLVVVSSWLALKEVALTVGKLVQVCPLNDKSQSTSQPAMLSIEQLHDIGKLYFTMLTFSKHNGTVSKAHTGLLAVTKRLLSSSNAAYQQVVHEWHRSLLDTVSFTNNTSNTWIRRSTGISLCLIAILQAENSAISGSSTNGQLLERSMQVLITLANDASNWKSQVHGLNLLRVIFKDSSLSLGTLQYVSVGVQASIDGFNHSVWAVRNAAHITYAAVMQKAVRAQYSTETMASHGMPISEFFVQFPTLINYLQSRLKTAIEHDISGKNPSASIHPYLYPTLLLLSKLSPSDKAQSDEVAAFVPLVHQCAKHPHHYVRHVASLAIVSVVSTSRVDGTIINTCHTLNSNSSNNTHGLLMQLQSLLAFYPTASSSDTQAVQLLLKQGDTMVRGTTPAPVTHAYLEVLYTLTTRQNGSDARSYPVQLLQLALKVLDQSNKNLTRRLAGVDQLNALACSVVVTLLAQDTKLVDASGLLHALLTQASSHVRCTTVSTLDSVLTNQPSSALLQQLDADYLIKELLSHLTRHDVRGRSAIVSLLATLLASNKPSQQHGQQMVTDVDVHSVLDTLLASGDDSVNASVMRLLSQLVLVALQHSVSADHPVLQLFVTSVKRFGSDEHSATRRHSAWLAIHTSTLLAQTSDDLQEARAVCWLTLASLLSDDSEVIRDDATLTAFTAIHAHSHSTPQQSYHVAQPTVAAVVYKQLIGHLANYYWQSPTVYSYILNKLAALADITHLPLMANSHKGSNASQLFHSERVSSDDEEQMVYEVMLLALTTVAKQRLMHPDQYATVTADVHKLLHTSLTQTIILLQHLTSLRRSDQSDVTRYVGSSTYDKDMFSALYSNAVNALVALQLLASADDAAVVSQYVTQFDQLRTLLQHLASSTSHPLLQPVLNSLQHMATVQQVDVHSLLLINTVDSTSTEPQTIKKTPTSNMRGLGGADDADKAVVVAEIEYYDLSSVDPLPDASGIKATSIWLDDTSADEAMPLLQELPDAVDCVIVGSGLTGSSAAYHMTQLKPGSRVLVVEANSRLCSGATGNNGGHMHCSNVAEAQNAAEIAEFCKKHQIDWEYVETGAYLASSNASQVAALQQTRDDAVKQDGVPDSARPTVDTTIITQQQCQEQLQASSLVKAALFNPKAGRCHPRKLTLGIARVAADAGAMFATGAAVTQVTYDRTTNLNTVHTSRGAITARTVLYATNGYTSKLLPYLQRQIKPVRNHVIRTTPMSRRLPMQAMSINEDFEYMIQRDAGDIVLGGGRYLSEYRPMDEGIDLQEVEFEQLPHDQKVCYMLNRWPAAMFPALSQQPPQITHRWQALLGFTPDFLPVVEPVPHVSGQFVCAGFSGHGMPRCHHSAKRACEMVVQYLASQ